MRESDERLRKHISLHICTLTFLFQSTGKVVLFPLAERVRKALIFLLKVSLLCFFVLSLSLDHSLIPLSPLVIFFSQRYTNTRDTRILLGFSLLRYLASHDVDVCNALLGLVPSARVIKGFFLLSHQKVAKN